MRGERVSPPHVFSVTQLLTGVLVLFFFLHTHYCTATPTFFVRSTSNTPFTSLQCYLCLIWLGWDRHPISTRLNIIPPKSVKGLVVSSFWPLYPFCFFLALILLAGLLFELRRRFIFFPRTLRLLWLPQAARLQFPGLATRSSRSIYLLGVLLPASFPLAASVFLNPSNSHFLFLHLVCVSPSVFGRTETDNICARPSRQLRRDTDFFTFFKTPLIPTLSVSSVCVSTHSPLLLSRLISVRFRWQQTSFWHRILLRLLPFFSAPSRLLSAAECLDERNSQRKKDKFRLLQQFVSTFTPFLPKEQKPRLFLCFLKPTSLRPALPATSINL